MKSIGLDSQLKEGEEISGIVIVDQHALGLPEDRKGIGLWIDTLFR